MFVFVCKVEFGMVSCVLICRMLSVCGCLLFVLLCGLCWVLILFLFLCKVVMGLLCKFVVCVVWCF